MPGYVNVIDSASGNVAGVTTDKEMKVSLSQAAGTAGFAKMLDGAGEPVHVTDTGALLTSGRELLITETVDGSALNTNKWITSTSGMTITQSNGFITLNAASATTANAYAILRSIKNVPLMGSLPVLVTGNIKTSVLPQANITIEFGVGTVATNALPTDGCYFRWNSNGNFQCIINNGLGETIVDSLTPPTTNDTSLMEIEIVEDAVAFFIDDVEIASVTVPLANAYPTNAARLPIFLRVYNGSSTPAVAPQTNLGQLTVVQQDAQLGRSWPTVLASFGQSAYQSPVTPFTQIANHDNSASPTSASLSNTVPSYSTLGGRYQFAAVVAAATDYALFAYQVPTGYQLFVNSIHISSLVTGLAVVTATVFDWSIGVNASAASLATVDGAGTWAPRRVPVGTQGFLALAGLAATANDIVRNFTTPLVVDSGRYLHVIVQVPAGAATASLIFRGNVTINGYFE